MTLTLASRRVILRSYERLMAARKRPAGREVNNDRIGGLDRIGRRRYVDLED